MTKKRWFSPSPPMVRKKEKKESHLPIQNSMLFAPHNVWVNIIKKKPEISIIYAAEIFMS